MLLGPVEGADTDAVAADGRRQPARPPLLHPRGAAASCASAGGGHIVNVSSVAGPHRERRRRAVYNLTKWGVDGLLRGPAPGGAATRTSASTVRRAGLRRHRAPGPQREPDGRRGDREDARADRRGARGRGHRQRDPLRGLPARARQHQRGPGPADRRSSAELGDPAYASVRDTVRDACRRRGQPRPRRRRAVGARVRALREAMDLSLRDLAQRSGVSAPMLLARSSAGETSPTLAVATRIAAGLDLTLSQLLRLDEDRHVVITRRGEGRTRRRARPPRRGADARRCPASAPRSRCTRLEPGAATGGARRPADARARQPRDASTSRPARSSSWSTATSTSSPRATARRSTPIFLTTSRTRAATRPACWPWSAAGLRSG